MGKVIRMIKMYRLLRVIRLPRIIERMEMFIDRGVLQVRARWHHVFKSTRKSKREDCVCNAVSQWRLQCAKGSGDGVLTRASAT